MVSGSPDRVGLLGTGRMGTALGSRLLDSGFTLEVWNRTESKTRELVDRGALVAPTISKLGQCPVVLISVSASDDLIAVLDRDTGLLASAASGSVIIDCSTVSPEASAAARRRCADADVAFLAAPVSGNPSVVRSARAAIAVSGPDDAFARVRHVLAALSSRVFHVGSQEQSRLVKLCQNLYLGMTIEALVEVLALAGAAGISTESFLSYLNSTVVGSEWLVNRTASIVARDWTPTFTLELLNKDFDLGLAEARQLQVTMSSADLVRGHIQAALAAGMKDLDMLGALFERQMRTK